MEEAGSQPISKKNEGFFRSVWKIWLKIAERIGTVQMMIVLTIMYWLFLPLMAIPFRFFSDPLAMKRERGGWIERPTGTDPSEVIKNQF